MPLNVFKARLDATQSDAVGTCSCGYILIPVMMLYDVLFVVLLFYVFMFHVEPT